MHRFKTLSLSVLAFFSASLIWSVATLFLAKTPTLFSPLKKEYSFYNIDLLGLFFEEQNRTTKPHTVKPIRKLGFKLKALYKNSKTGFIIIEDKKKNRFIDINGIYKGYKLVKIYSSGAVFRKNGIDYRVEFEKPKNSQIDTLNIHSTPMKNIPKKLFLEYKNNFTKIWQNIGIIKVDQGYKITFVKKGSIFDRMGLKKGDILLVVNDRELDNDAQAWNLYKNAEKFKRFEITILRNNKEKVLEYEVD